MLLTSHIADIIWRNSGTIFLFVDTVFFTGVPGKCSVVSVLQVRFSKLLCFCIQFFIFILACTTIFTLILIIRIFFLYFFTSRRRSWRPYQDGIQSCFSSTDHCYSPPISRIDSHEHSSGFLVLPITSALNFFSFSLSVFLRMLSLP